MRRSLFLTMPILAPLLLMAIAPLALAQTSASAPDASAIATGHLAGAGGDPFLEYLEEGETDPSIPSPEAGLGYPIGGRFTRHADTLRYLRTLAEASDRIRIETYGQTHEQRDLVVCTISSPANLRNLDGILAANTALADPRTRSASDVASAIENSPAIVWFSFNVHGNEPSSTETAMQLAYTLAASDDPAVRAILDNVVLVIDPCLNPDGRERYVSWSRGVTGASPNPNADAAEHFEPWPQGRTNHYYFDLNRDWLWGVQPESRARLAIYKRYLPHLHIDFHEQGYQSPYFFGLGDKPFNKNIPQETIDWVARFGAANAEAFDERGLVYATKERFDYLYPGYGKVLPTYHGAVGMLCEKGGHSRAGLAIDFSDDHVLTLRERIAHHFIVAMSDLRYAAANRRENTERFARYFTLPADRDFYAPVTYAISKDNDPVLLGKLADLCAMQGIEIHEPARGARVRGADFLDYRTGKASETPPDLGDCWLIPGDQPRGALVRAIFERATTVEEPETYDITGWSLPIVFGLDAWTIEKAVPGPRVEYTELQRPPAIESTGNVATIIGADQHNFPAAVGALIRHDCFARLAGAPFAIDGRSFPAGSLIVHHIRNARSIDAFLEDCNSLGVSTHGTGRGVTEQGRVLGANDNARFVSPSILLVRNDPVSSYSFGQLWNLLDIQFRIPHTAVNADDLRRVDLDSYNVIVVPHLGGSLAEKLDEATAGDLDDWVRAGGTLVAIGSASDWAAKRFLGEPDDQPDDRADAHDNNGKGDTGQEEDPEDRDLTWSQRKQRNVNRNIPGALLVADVDTGHPLAAGVRDWVGVIKRGDRVAPLRANGQAIARFDRDAPVIGGVISDDKADEIAGKAFATRHRVGSGSVVCFSDDVTIRGFAHAPVRLILNAITLGPTIN